MLGQCFQLAVEFVHSILVRLARHLLHSSFHLIRCQRHSIHDALVKLALFLCDSSNLFSASVLLSAITGESLSDRLDSWLDSCRFFSFFLLFLVNNDVFCSLNIPLSLSSPIVALSLELE